MFPVLPAIFHVSELREGSTFSEEYTKTVALVMLVQLTMLISIIKCKKISVKLFLNHVFFLNKLIKSCFRETNLSHSTLLII